MPKFDVNGITLEYQIGDCLELMKDIPDNSIDLVIADPPYNENKAEWDRIDNYMDWWGARVYEFVRTLKDNGVFYFYQMNIETAMDMHIICKNQGLVLRQMITIDKGIQAVAGRTSENLRSYPKATEYLFYYTFNDLTGAEQLSDTYQRINPMAKYLKGEIERAGVTQSELRALFPSRTGKETGCITNWVKGYNFPLKWQYERIREHLNKNGNEYLRREYEDLRREYEDLRREYEDLRREYEGLRYTFNLPYGVTDVWYFNFYADKVEGHETPKPIPLTKRIIESSSNQNATILFPFLGTGNDLMACRILFRNGIGFEINPDYEPIIRKRIMADIPAIESYAIVENPLKPSEGDITL